MKPMQVMMGDGLLARLDAEDEVRRAGRSVVLRRVQRRLAALGVALVACLSPSMGAAQQNLGHKIPGVAGLDAGRQTEPGVFVSDRVVYYDVIRLRDRNGEPVFVPGLDMWAVTNAVGVSWTARLASGLLVTVAASVPIARLHVSVDDPLATVDTFGLGDVYVKPVQIGWRWRRADVLASYGVYSPTRQTAREGLGGPQWAHQVSAGGTLFFDEGRSAFASALVSYDVYQRKQDIDVRRGNSIQVQGGAGGTVRGILEIGLAGFGLWQVQNDRGSDLPDALRGRRDRAFGLGPEINVLLPALPGKVGVRYLHDMGVQARPEGQLLAITLSVFVWAPGR